MSCMVHDVPDEQFEIFSNITPWVAVCGKSWKLGDRDYGVHGGHHASIKSDSVNCRDCLAKRNMSAPASPPPVVTHSRGPCCYRRCRDRAQYAGGRYCKRHADEWERVEMVHVATHSSLIGDKDAIDLSPHLHSVKLRAPMVPPQPCDNDEDVP